MFLRYKDRRKDGKQHRYWSVVENTRVAGGRVVQRHVLYLGEINGTQELAWRRSIEVLAEGETRLRTLSLFPEDRCEGLLGDASIVRVKLSALRLRRPRQWGACWLALTLRADHSSGLYTHPVQIAKRPYQTRSAWVRPFTRFKRHPFTGPGWA